MAKRLKSFDLDDSNALKVIGFLEGLATDIKKDSVLGPVLDSVVRDLDRAFTAHMTAIAPGQRSRFHHVYEWGAIGVPQAKLWDTSVSGRGASKSVSFLWRASKTAVPLPDPLPAPGPNGQQLQGGHVFTWKAPMMEYSIPVRITPTLAEALAFPAADIGETPMRNDLWFSRGTVRFDAPPNSRLAAGQFTKAFIEWWGGDGAADAFNNGPRKEIEESLGSGSRRAIRGMDVARPNMAGATSAQRAKALNSGKSKAAAFLREWSDERESYRSTELIRRNRQSSGRFGAWR